MRKYPKSFSELIKKHNLINVKLTYDEFVYKAKNDVIFRNDFAFVSLFLDLQMLEKENMEFGINTPLKLIFIESDIAKKWNEFRKLTNLSIPDLKGKSNKHFIYILIIMIGSFSGLYFIFSYQDLSFFTMLHPEILNIGFIAIMIIIVGLDYFIEKLWPNNEKYEVPFYLNSDDVRGFITKVLTYNRTKIKNNFAELYQQRFEQFGAEKTHHNTA
ncbi:hypothetical protein G3567_13070 [Psychroflexus sp. YR1-1]|uniref:Uncharacterized protein n=1 Tax=Psychroflexus aurantiacus TaxID=2709310 RepID=A0A6B3R316_9FLAO|nr:hypothetical protein [Psychroflexus aurantiacus]NEV95069.1 hypothetical protein [Psychroflexus aurantiacus]